MSWSCRICPNEVTCRISIEEIQSIHTDRWVNQSDLGYDSLVQKSNRYDSLALYRHHFPQGYIIGVKTNKVNSKLLAVANQLKAVYNSTSCPCDIEQFDLNSKNSNDVYLAKSYDWWICKSKQDCVRIWNAI